MTLPPGGPGACDSGKAVGCTGTEADCESIADDCVGKLTAALPDTGSRCEAAKLKAAGVKARAMLVCYVKAARKGMPVDGSPGGCLARAAARFAAAFGKAERAGACSGAEGTIETMVDDECVGQQIVLDGGGNVTGICP